jgi:16S rRNA (uracil1498-N3)-methyltransferase
MHRFLVPPDRSRSDRFQLGEAEARHAFQVLRLGPGDPVRILDGAGGVLDAVIESANKREVHVGVRSRATIPPPKVRITLLLALLKGRALDFVLEKAVELGATALVLVDATRSVARVAPGDVARKQESWRQTLAEAAKQSGNPWLPTLEGPLELPEALKSADPEQKGLLYVASLHPQARSLGSALDADRKGEGSIKSIGIAIGPEGDFTPEENLLLEQSGATPVSLGPLVLRAETAALAALSVIGDHARR